MHFVSAFTVISILFCASHCNDTLPSPTIVAYEPHGLRISLRDGDGVSEIYFWANINRELKGSDIGDILLDAIEPTDGEWVIEDEEIPLTRGDVIYYNLYVIKNGLRHKLEQMSYKITDIAPRPTTTSTTTLSTTSIASTTPSTVPTTAPTPTTPTTSTTPPTPTTPITTPTTPTGITTLVTKSTTPSDSSTSVECEEILINVDALLPMSLAGSHKGKYYSVPTPEIVVYEKGFRVSIPDEPGIGLFYFHGRKGNINTSLEADAISMVTRQRSDGNWTVYDNSTCFTAGDFIQYWLYVRKNNVGYRMNSGYYKVREIQPYELIVTPSQTGLPCISKKPSTPANVPCSSFCENELNNVTRTLNKLQSEVDLLKNVTKVLVNAMNGKNNLSYYEKWNYE